MKRSLLAASILSLALTGCSSVYVPSFIKVYRPDIEQGNVIEARQVQQLHVGMSRSAVHRILGTPALHDIFHRGQQDTYVFYDKRGKNKAFQHTLTLRYDPNGSVTKIEQDGDPLSKTPKKDLPDVTKKKVKKTDETEPATAKKKKKPDPYALSPPPGSDGGLGNTPSPLTPP